MSSSHPEGSASTGLGPTSAPPGDWLECNSGQGLGGSVHEVLDRGLGHPVQQGPVNQLAGHAEGRDVPGGQRENRTDSPISISTRLWMRWPGDPMPTSARRRSPLASASEARPGTQDCGERSRASSAGPNGTVRSVNARTNIPAMIEAATAGPQGRPSRAARDQWPLPPARGSLKPTATRGAGSGPWFPRSTCSPGASPRPGRRSGPAGWGAPGPGRTRPRGRTRGRRRRSPGPPRPRGGAG